MGQSGTIATTMSQISSNGMVTKMKMTRTVRDFQNALLELLEDHPFDRLTVDQICKGAMLHRSSFYRYFHDKYDLLEQTLLNLINKLVTGCKDEAEIINVVMDYISKHRNLILNLTDTDANGSLDSEMLKILNQIFLDQMRTSKSKSSLLQALRQSNNPKLLASIFSGSIIGAAYWWRNTDFKVPSAEVIKTIESSIEVLAQVQTPQQKVQ